MPRHRSTVLFAVALFGVASLAHPQGYSDSARNYEERLRQDAARQEAERARAHDHLQEDMRRNRERWSEHGRPPTGEAPSNDTSFFTKVAGVATVILTYTVLQELFAPGGRDGASRVPGGAHLDASVERWLQDPRNRSGVPYRFDTPDGMTSKVCIRPFRDVQTVVYRWDAPNEAARAVEIAETPTREHIQFSHPSARGLFIYVTRPAPNHKPSDKVYWLAAHRIGTTGCGHAQAYQIVYHKFGGPPEFEGVAHGPRLRQEEPVENLPPFTRSCQAYHGQAACACLAISLMRLIPGLVSREYDPAEVRAALREHPRVAESVAQRCKVQM
jgi:hypothetical protein